MKIFNKHNPFIISFIVSIISILYSIISYEILSLFKINEIGGFIFKNDIQKFLISTILGPIFETFLFQFITYYIRKFIYEEFPKKILNPRFFNTVYIIISSILFAISHTYSNWYIILMILPGALLSYMFIFFKKNEQNAFIYTSVIHFFHNLFVFLLEYFKIY